MPNAAVFVRSLTGGKANPMDVTTTTPIAAIAVAGPSFTEEGRRAAALSRVAANAWLATANGAAAVRTRLPLKSTLAPVSLTQEDAFSFNNPVLPSNHPTAGR